MAERMMLDAILDGVRAREREVTFDVEGCSEAQIERIIEAATTRGLHAARSRHHVLVRDLRGIDSLKEE